MSKANGAIEKKDTFLQHVSLKNYKSIKDVEIDFKPGLNVIIGKNASGKTNFINGLNTLLNFNFNQLLDSEAIIKLLFKSNQILIKALNVTSKNEEALRDEYYNGLMSHDIFLNVNNVDIKIDHYEDLKEELFDSSYFFYPILIKYGIQYKENSQFINVPFNFTIISNGRVSRELMMVTMNDNRTEFVQLFFHRLYMNTVKLYRDRKQIIPNEDLRDEIISFSAHYFRKINNLISTYSPISEIRINSDFNLIFEEASQKIAVTNFYLEFLVDNTWRTFNLLSDGSKRLFYVISEMLFNNQLIENEDFNIILLEEPELGIHPHQLHQLMQFIKEQSKEKQIILTTHSPQVLDALEPDELDRIIICHSDPKNGTQLSHLSDQQIKKAKKYMASEAFLSDYWRFSDLEPA